MGLSILWSVGAFGAAGRVGVARLVLVLEEAPAKGKAFPAGAAPPVRAGLQLARARSKVARQHRLSKQPLKQPLALIGGGALRRKVVGTRAGRERALRTKCSSSSTHARTFSKLPVPLCCRNSSVGLASNKTETKTKAILSLLLLFKPLTRCRFSLKYRSSPSFIKRSRVFKSGALNMDSLIV
jgi:hypothetical protein